MDAPVRIPKGVKEHPALRVLPDGTIRVVKEKGGEFAPRQRLVGNSPYVAPEHRERPVVAMKGCLYNGWQGVKAYHDVADEMRERWEKEWRERYSSPPPSLDDAFDTLTSLATVVRGFVKTIKPSAETTQLYMHPDETSFWLYTNIPPSICFALYDACLDAVHCAPKGTWLLLRAMVAPPSDEVFEAVHLLSHELMHKGNVYPLQIELWRESTAATFRQLVAEGFLKEEDEADFRALARSTSRMVEGIADVGSLLCARAFSATVAHEPSFAAVAAEPFFSRAFYYACYYKAQLRALLQLITSAEGKAPEVARLLLSLMREELPQAIFPRLLGGLCEIYGVPRSIVSWLIADGRIREMAEWMSRSRRINTATRCAHQFVEIARRLGAEQQPLTQERCQTIVTDVLASTRLPRRMQGRDVVEGAFDLLSQVFFERLVASHSVEV